MEIKAKDRMDKMKRREFLGLGGKAAVGIAASGLLPLGGVAASAATSPKKDYYAFSRVFQFLDWDHAAELLAKAGYTGVEWTVRAKGHVEPARAREDLPKAVRAAEKQGLDGIMITKPVIEKAEMHFKTLKSKCSYTDPASREMAMIYQVAIEGIKMIRESGQQTMKEDRPGK